MENEAIVRRRERIEMYRPNQLDFSIQDEEGWEANIKFDSLLGWIHWSALDFQEKSL